MPLPLIAGIAALAGNKTVRAVAGTAFKGVVRGLGFTKKVAKPAAAVVGTAAAWEAGSAGVKALTAPKTASLPALPGMSGGLPSFGNAASGSGTLAPMGGKASQVFSMPEMLAMDHPSLRLFYRAPKGYVVVKNKATGEYVGAVRKDVARRAGIWRPSAKPPISATDWKHYKSAERTEKKLKKIASKAFRKKTVIVKKGRGK